PHARPFHRAGCPILESIQSAVADPTYGVARHALDLEPFIERSAQPRLVRLGLDGVDQETTGRRRDPTTRRVARVAVYGRNSLLHACPDGIELIVDESSRSA